MTAFRTIKPIVIFVLDEPGFVSLAEITVPFGTLKMPVLPTALTLTILCVFYFFATVHTLGTS